MRIAGRIPLRSTKRPLLAILFSLFLLSPQTALPDTCCSRSIDSRITGNPAGVSDVDLRMIKTSVDSGFTYHGPWEADCPVSLEMFEKKDTEYTLDYDISATPSHIKGNYYIFYAKLVDPHHGNVLAGPAKVQWHGERKDHHIVNPDGADRDLIKELVQYLRPLDDKIHDYERIPESATIRPDKEELDGGETTTIRITDIRDGQGRPPQPWQRIVVQVDIGRIRNGVDKHPLYIFEVGEKGEIDVIYEAPEKCDFDTEVITVSNSCNWMHDLFSTLPERELARKELKIDDRKPVSCKVDPEKSPAEPGGEITVRLSDFREFEGRPLRPEEKILVRAEKGEIKNGAPHGEYRMFTIGNGVVDVTYEAPGLCGLEKDVLLVYNVCEDREKKTFGPDKEIAKKTIPLRTVSCDVSVDIVAQFQWVHNEKDRKTEGNASMRIRGEMAFDESVKLPYVKRYVPKKMSVTWSMKDTATDLSGDPDCPPLIFELFGGGSTGMPDPRLLRSSFLEIHRFGDLLPPGMPVPVPPEAREQLVDSFQLVLGGAEQKIPYKERKGSTCGERSCPCKEYKKTDKKLGVGSVAIRGKTGKDGVMTGQHYWQASGASPRTIRFEVSEIGQKPHYRPRPMEKPGYGVTAISVRWEIKVFR